MNRDQTWSIPPLHVQLHEQDALVWPASLTGPEFARVDLQRVLAKEEIARVARFHFEKDRNHWMVSQGILRILLSRYVNIDPSRLSFSSNDYGKPFLTSAQ
jgi:4'-phosphopantetheinyl transferase